MKLYNGDCFDILKELPPNSVDAVITDPPYGSTSIGWDTAPNLARWWEEVERVLRTPNSPVIVFADQPFSSRVLLSKEKWFRHDWVWKKPQHSGAQLVKYKPLKYTEDILVFSKETANYYWDAVVTELEKPKTIDNNLSSLGRMLGDDRTFEGKHTTKYTGFPKEVLEYASPRKGRIHPTQKPVELLEYLVNLYTRKGDVVLDTFMGSGSTGKACKNLDRDFIGVEMEKEYYDYCVESLNSDISDTI